MVSVANKSSSIHANLQHDFHEVDLYLQVISGGVLEQVKNQSRERPNLVSNQMQLTGPNRLQTVFKLRA